MTPDDLIERIDDLVELVETLADEADAMGDKSTCSWLTSAEDCLNRARASLTGEWDDY